MTIFFLWRHTALYHRGAPQLPDQLFVRDVQKNLAAEINDYAFSKFSLRSSFDLSFGTSYII